jgi:hypothetical protein
MAKCGCARGVPRRHSLTKRKRPSLLTVTSSERLEQHKQVFEIDPLC